MWRVSKGDELALDAYEGYPEFYRKERFSVQLRDLALGGVIGKIQAFAYVMAEGRPAGMPHATYVATCLEGYQRFHLDERILARAYDESLEEGRG